MKNMNMNTIEQELSVKFKKMGQKEFEQFIDKLIYMYCKHHSSSYGLKYNTIYFDEFIK